jgi:transposase
LLSDFNKSLKRIDMAGKTTNMSQIKQLLILQEQGKRIKTIARSLGISKNTVKAYLQKLDALGSRRVNPITAEQLIHLPEPELEAVFHAGNPAYKDDRYTFLKEKISYYRSQLEQIGVTKKLLWQEYKEANPNGYSYAQFCFHLQQMLIAAKPSMVLHHMAGDKLFIDFAGKKLSYTNKDTGELIGCEVFVACLPFSDYSFAMAVPSQSSVDFIYGLTCCLESLGGAPQAIVSDNLKAAVIKANRYEPDINRILADFANHYCTAVLPARAYKPKDKALVENQVNLIYTRVYARLRNMQFFDIDTLNEAIALMVKEHNQTRMQQKPYSREERFIAEELPQLIKLPKEKFEVKNYRELKVAPNNHIYLSIDKHYYSVPYKLIGCKVKVIFSRTMVYIYHDGTQVAVHPRNYQNGTYTSHKGHLCSEHQHFLNRSPQYYTSIAANRSKILHSLFELIFSQNKYPEQLYNTCDGLLRLHQKSDKVAFEKACQLAIEHRQTNYTFIKNILTNKMTAMAQQPTEDKPLPQHNNVRGKQYYQQTLDFNNQ